MTISEILRPHFGPMYEIISGGFDDYEKLYSGEVKIAHDASCRAHIRNCHMRDRASKYATAHSVDERMFESKGLQGILINQRITILFKKLNDSLRPRNNSTKQIDDYLAQREIAGIPAIVKLVAGYTEDDETGALTGVYVICPSGLQNRWEFHLTVDEAVQVSIPLFEEEEDVEEVDIFTRREPGEVIPIRKDGKDDD